MKTTHEIIVMLSLLEQGSWSRQYDFILNQKDLNTVAGEAIMGKYLANGIDFITILDSDYPTKLSLNSPKPPLCIAFKGDINLLNAKNVLGYFSATPCFSPISDKKLTIMCYIKDLQNARKEFPSANFIVIVNGIDALCDVETLPNVLFITTTLSDIENRMVLPKRCTHLLCGGNYNKAGYVDTIICTALSTGADILVFPTEKQSWGNELIKSGAYCIDKPEDIEFELGNDYE